MRLLLCDRHRLFAESLAHVLCNRGYEVQLVGAPEEVVDALYVLPFDLCILELDFGIARVVSTIELLRATRPPTSVLILSGIDDPRLIAPVLAAGAAGVVSKEDGLGRILDTLARVASGDQPAVGKLAPSVSLKGAASRHRLHELTPREREVLRHLLLGEPTSVIAASIGVSHATARTHIQNVLAKLEVHSRLEAVALAIRQSLEPIDLSGRWVQKRSAAAEGAQENDHRITSAREDAG